MEKLLTELRLKADNCDNTKEGRARKGAYVDCIVKCRKPHKCDYCDTIITVGEMAIYCEGKTARYDKDDKQNGIHFWKSWVHADIEVCQKNGAD
jgi:hypothetical protein